MRRRPKGAPRGQGLDRQLDSGDAEPVVSHLQPWGGNATSIDLHAEDLHPAEGREFELAVCRYHESRVGLEVAECQRDPQGIGLVVAQEDLVARCGMVRPMRRAPLSVRSLHEP